MKMQFDELRCITCRQLDYECKCITIPQDVLIIGETFTALWRKHKDKVDWNKELKELMEEGS